MSLSVSALKAAFGSYFINAGQGQKDIYEEYLVPSATEAAWAPLITTTDTQVRKMKSSLTDVLQPYQKALTPSGTLTVAPLSKSLTKMKYETIVDPDTIEDTYAGFLASIDTNDRKAWPITRYVAMKMLSKGREAFETKAIYKGVYLAPTPGTAGAAADAFDGLGTQIAADITATTITPVATGVLATDASDLAKQIEQWVVDCRAVSATQAEIIDNYCTEIFCDKAIALLAAKGFGINYNTQYNQTGASIMTAVYRVQIPFTNLTLVGLPSMSGKKRLVMTPSENRLCRVKRPASEAAAEMYVNGREITLFSDHWKAVSYWDPAYMFVNDQA